MVRRIFGSDVNPINRQTISAVGQQVGRQQQTLQGGISTAMQAGQQISSEAVQSLQSTRDMLSTRQEAAATRQKRLAKDGHFFERLGETIMGLSKPKQDLVKAAMEKQKSQGLQEYVLAKQEVEEMVARGTESMGESGSKVFEAEMLRNLGKYRNIAPKDVAQLLDTGYAKINEFETTQAKKRIENTDMLRKVQLDMTKKQVSQKLTGLLLQVAENPGDSEKYEGKLNKFLAEVGESQTWMKPLEFAKLQLHAYEAFVDTYQGSIDEKSSIRLELEGLRGYTDYLVNLEKRTDLSREAKDLMAQDAAIEFGVKREQALYTLDKVSQEKSIEQSVNAAQASRKLKDLAKKEQIDLMSNKELDHDHIKYLTMAFVTNPTLRLKYTTHDVLKHEANVKIADALSKDYKAVLENTRKADIKISQTQQKIEAYKKAQNLFLASNGERGLTLLQTTYKALLDMYRLNGQEASALALENKLGPDIMGLDKDNPFGITEEDRERAKEEWRIASESGLALMEQELALLATQAQEMTFTGMAQYGFPKTLTKLAVETAEQDFINKLTEAEKYILNVQSTEPEAAATGLRPVFKLGDRAKNLTIRSERIGKDMVTPFEVGTEGVSIRHSRGKAGSPHAGHRARDHAGIDFWAPLGTRAVSMVNGKVSEVTYQVKANGFGYGHYIDITDTDGMVHRYAHLQHAPNLKVGDVVKPGDVVGLVGQSGTKVDPHLHYEIRNGNTFGYSGTHDPELVLSDQYEQLHSNIPAGNNLGHYETLRNPFDTAPEYGDNSGFVPASSYPLPSGKWMLNGQVLSTDPNDTTVQKAETVHNQANPVTLDFARADKVGWSPSMNDGTKHFGHTYLAENQEFTRKLHEVATEFEFPTYWLADILAFESNFNANNYEPMSDSYGIGNFSRDELQMLPEINNGVALKEDFNEINATKQLEILRLKLDRFKGRMGRAPNNMRELAILFYTGSDTNDDYAAFELEQEVFGQTDTNYLDNLTDANGMTFETYLQKIGGNAKRKYEASRAYRNLARLAPIHTEFNSGCVHCQAMKYSGSEIIPHQGLIA